MTEAEIVAKAIRDAGQDVFSGFDRLADAMQELSRQVEANNSIHQAMMDEEEDGDEF